MNITEKAEWSSYLLDQWDWELNTDLDPKNITSREKVWWRHEVKDFKGDLHSHSWEMNVSDRIRKARGCPICHGSKILSGFNDFITFFNYYYSEKLEIVYSAEDLSSALCSSRDKTVTIKCRKCDTLQTSILKRLYTASKSNNRAVCPCEMKSHSDVAEGINDLVTYCKENALNLMDDWDAVKNEVLPESIRRGSGKKRWWRCRKCDFSWEQSPHMRTKLINPRGCPACANRVLYAGVNDLQTVNPDVAEELVVKDGELVASKIIAASSKMRDWICSECSFEFKASIALRANRIVVCRKCKRGSLERNFTERILNELSSLIITHEIGNRTLLAGKEVDLLIVSTEGEKLGFEFNGAYWHSTLRQRSSDQHFCKAKNALFKGVSLHFIWEDEWINNSASVIESIRNLLSSKRLPLKADWHLGSLDKIAPSNINAFTYNSETVRTIVRRGFECSDGGKAIFAPKA